MSETNTERTLTYGEKAVGLNFNPAGDPKVARLKEIFAEAIDIVYAGEDSVQVMEGQFLDLAFNQIVLAQMAAVKSVTWSK